MSTPFDPRVTGLSRRAILSAWAPIAVAGTASAAPQPILRIEPLRNGARLHHQHGVCEITFLVSGVASVTRGLPSRIAASRSVLTRSDSAFQATILENENEVRIISDQVIVSADKLSGALAFFDTSARQRLAEAPVAAPIAGVTQTCAQAFAIELQESLYGLGAFRAPLSDYRNATIFLAQANSDDVNPFLTSTGNWGVLWDTAAASFFRSIDDRISFHALAGDVVRYHVAIGDSMDAVIARYRALTGAAPLFGKWAYGYWQSKERYQNQGEITAVVDEYRNRGLPFDNIILDWRYWGESEFFSGMTFDSSNFPDPKAMVDDVHAQGAHIIASVWPAFGANTAIYREMDQNGFLFPEPHWSGGRVYDASSPLARDIYWRHAKAGLLDIGMDGFWTDGVEPEFMATGDRYGTLQSYTVNGQGAAGSIDERALAFSLDHSKGLYENMRRDAPQKRPFILSRSSFTGQHAYGSTTWSGDIFASWGTLRDQISAGVQMSMSGLPYWTCDIGAFLVNHRYPRGLADPAYKELYVRWFQFGAFLPIFRAHGTHVPREVWRFGEPGDPFYDALAKALELRYALMPYIYANAAAVTFEGGSFLRGLAMDFPADPNCRAQEAHYMFGPSLLVCVVDRPLFHANENTQEFLPSYAVQGHDAPAARVEYFEGVDFAAPVAQRLTDEIKLTWFGDLPTFLRGKPYSVRWTGRIQAQESGAHTFAIAGQGRIRFFFDGRLIVDGQGGSSGATNAGNGGVTFVQHTGDDHYIARVSLEQGRHYDFQLEQAQPTPDTISLWLEWITPSQRQRMRIPSRKTVPVYLPRGADWYDFHSGAHYSGGRTINAEAPLASHPLYARAGAIIPMTPGITRAGTLVEALEIRVFAGADGAFTLYDDEGDGHGYESRAHAWTPITWRDGSRSLELGPRRGAYPGMASAVRVKIIVTDPHGQTVRDDLVFTGERLDISF